MRRRGNGSRKASRGETGSFGKRRLAGVRQQLRRQGPAGPGRNRPRIGRLRRRPPVLGANPSRRRPAGPAADMARLSRHDARPGHGPRPAGVGFDLGRRRRSGAGGAGGVRSPAPRGARPPGRPGGELRRSPGPIGRPKHLVAESAGLARLADLRRQPRAQQDRPASDRRRRKSPGEFRCRRTPRPPTGGPNKLLAWPTRRVAFR